MSLSLCRTFNTALKSSCPHTSMDSVISENRPHMEDSLPAHGHYGQGLLFLLMSRDSDPFLSTPDLYLDLDLLHCQWYISASPWRSNVQTSKTQVTSILNILQILLISNFPWPWKHQTLTAWGWGYKEEIPASFCWGLARGRNCWHQRVFF